MVLEDGLEDAFAGRVCRKLLPDGRGMLGGGDAFTLRPAQGLWYCISTAKMRYF